MSNVSFLKYEIIPKSLLYQCPVLWEEITGSES